MKAAVKAETLAPRREFNFVAQGKYPAWLMPLAKSALVCADVAATVAAYYTAFILREGDRIFVVASNGTRDWSAEFAPYGALLGFVILLRLATLKYYKLYRLRGEFSLVEDGVRMFKAVGLGTLLILATAFLYRGGFEFRAFSYARGVFLLDFFFALVLCGALRLATRGAQTFIRRRGGNLIPTFVVGRGREAALCIHEMQTRPALGYRVVGVIESGRLDSQTPAEFEGVAVVTDLSGLAEAIKRARVNEVIVADDKVSTDTLFDVMMQAGRRRRGVEFRIAPNLFNLMPRKTEIQQIGALPMISLFREPLTDAARFLKRASDIVIAAVALLILLPVWLIIALLVKLDSRGAIFYRQERVGMDGRKFLFIKFRTMRADTDDALHREYQRKLIAGEAGANLGDNDKPIFKVADDPRITRTGRILRRLSLDELPQLLNVLIGDMSIVGPRPPIPYEVEAYELWHRKRLDMKPGITGLWQVSGRNRLSFEEMVRLDLFYIENWSLWLDLKIILKTLPVMLRGDDAY